MNNHACPRCTQDLCEDCFNDAIMSIDATPLSTIYTPIRGMSLDDQLEARRKRVAAGEEKLRPLNYYRDRWTPSRANHYAAWQQKQALFS